MKRAALIILLAGLACVGIGILIFSFVLRTEKKDKVASSLEKARAAKAAKRMEPDPLDVDTIETETDNGSENLHSEI